MIVQKCTSDLMYVADDTGKSASGCHWLGLLHTVCESCQSRQVQTFVVTELLRCVRSTVLSLNYLKLMKIYIAVFVLEA